MALALRYFFWAVARMILSLRYRIRVHGLEEARRCCAERTLLLPNHPAFMDPILVFAALWPALKPRPLLYEGNFHNPVFYPLMKLLRAVPLPDMERPSAKARARTERALTEVIEGLRKGENHMLWPSGTLWRDGVERLGGAQATSQILQAVPDANVLLVRTRGLWGSSFSFAPTGTRPSLVRRLLAGAGWLLRNQLLFMPRRTVDITVERLDRSQLPGLERNVLNPWLEKWYNAPGREAPTYVPYHYLWGPRTYEFPRGAAADPQLAQVTPQTRTEVIQILERKLKRKLTEEEKQSETVIAQLGMDSLDRMDVTLEVEQRFGFSGEQSPSTLGDLWLLAQGLVKKADARVAPRAWFRQPGEGKPAIEGETIAAAFVAQALAHPGDVAVADDQAGALTYGRLLAGALTLARRFGGLPGKNVGLLLPASVAGDMALLALQLAGKVPVVLNWTTGPANLAHAAKLLELRHVVTSNQFIDRLEEKAVKALQDAGAQYLCLEEIREGMRRRELLGALLTVRLRPGRVRGQVPKVSPDEPAVVLFTSGSEKAPKAVPLTHGNLLSNQRACLAALGLTRRDAILGFLPLFHSFGLSVTGLLPLLSGIRVVHHPDPTAASTLARKIDVYQPTLLAGTPTFVGAILDRAESRPEQLRSLRYLFVGAERAPESLAAHSRKLVPQAHLLEGYGITECAPVIAVNPPDAPRPGTVGRPLPGVEVCVVEMKGGDPEALGDELPPGERGMLLVHGPNVFPGYLGQEGKPPFVERGGKRWYVTGDLAERDADGYIRLAGRLKRFLKAGGEMISLPALEAPFARSHPTTDEGPRMAVEGTEAPRRIILFTTEPISLQEANDLLHKEGFRGILRFDEVRRLEAIPTLGSGKVDYKALRALVAEAGPPAETARVGPAPTAGR
jgi:long-chain-fatty-acid--[acyl-carrier-protein] ligase